MNQYYDNETESETNEINEINEIENNISNIISTQNKHNTDLSQLSQLSSDSEVDTNTDNLENMKKLVYQCVKYENEIKKLDTYKKELNIKLKQIKTSLIPFMENNDIDFININKKNGGGKLKYTKKKTFSSMSKKYLFDSFKKFFNNEKQAEKLLEYLYENRLCKENINIIKSKK